MIVKMVARDSVRTKASDITTTRATRRQPVNNSVASARPSARARPAALGSTQVPPRRMLVATLSPAYATRATSTSGEYPKARRYASVLYPGSTASTKMPYAPLTAVETA